MLYGSTKREPVIYLVLKVTVEVLLPVTPFEFFAESHDLTPPVRRETLSKI